MSASCQITRRGVRSNRSGLDSVMYKDPNVKPWQSIHYIPPGFSSRYGNKKSVAGDTSPQDINPEKYANGHSNGYGKNKEGNGVMDHVEHTNGGAHN